MAEGEHPDGPESGSDAARTGLSPNLLAALAAHPMEIAALLDSFHRRVADHPGMLDLMQLVAAQAVRLIDGVHWAGITTRLDGVAFTVAHTDERVLVVDEGQYRIHEGPCLSALDRATPVRMNLNDLRARWPLLADTAENVGVRVILAVPVVAHGVPTAVLNLYGDADEGLRNVDADVMTVLTEYLRRGTQDLIAAEPADNPGVRFRQALHGRAVTDTAVGFVMAQHSLDAVDARTLIQHRALRRGITTEGYAEELSSQVTSTRKPPA